MVKNHCSSGGNTTTPVKSAGSPGVLWWCATALLMLACASWAAAWEPACRLVDDGLFRPFLIQQSLGTEAVHTKLTTP